MKWFEFIWKIGSAEDKVMTGGRIPECSFGGMPVGAALEKPGNTTAWILNVADRGNKGTSQNKIIIKIGGPHRTDRIIAEEF